MVEKIISILAGFIIGTIARLGYGGIVLLMAIESACIPLPSEIIMPFAGYLVHLGQFTLLGAGFWGAVGCVVGSIPAYYLGIYGGRPIIERYGRYLLVSHHELDLADRLFARHVLAGLQQEASPGSLPSGRPIRPAISSNAPINARASPTAMRVRPIGP